MKKRWLVAAVVVLTAILVAALGFYLPASAGAGPEGLVGIPWGASPEQVERAMAERHFPKDSDWRADQWIYDGSFDGYPAYISFRFQNNKFVEGGVVLIDAFHSIDDGKHYDTLADEYFDTLERQLIQRYGQPNGRYRAERGDPWQPWKDRWEVISDNGHAVIINLSKCHAYRDRNIDLYSRVAITYHNLTLLGQ